MATSHLFYLHTGSQTTPLHTTPAELWGEHKETEGGGSADKYENSLQTLHVHHSAQWRSNISTRYLWKTISLFQSTDHLILCCFHPDLRFECLHNKKRKEDDFNPGLECKAVHREGYIHTVPFYFHLKMTPWEAHAVISHQNKNSLFACHPIKIQSGDRGQHSSAWYSWNNS